MSFLVKYLDIYVSNYQIQNQLKNFVSYSNNFNIDIKKINLYKNYLFSKNYEFNNKYISIHLDEKWYTKFYYRDFTDINPNSKQIEEL